MRKNKIIVLTIGLSGIVSYFICKNSVNTGICDSSDYACRTLLDSFEKTLFFFFFFFFFSLLAYKLPEAISRTWIKYALFTTPIVLAISLYINLGLHHSPIGDLQDMFDQPALWLLYILFSIGSLISITVGWRKNKKQNA